MSRTGTAVAVAAFVAVGAAAVYWVPGLLNGDRQRVPTERCTVAQDDISHSLTAEQANNAALIAAVGSREGFGVAGITVALATAIQESSLRNLDYGDRDSLGLFQQRPSQGWGSAEQIADPYYSTETFYAALLKVSGWEDMAVTDAAQAVQRSGFPLAYADHEDEALAWAVAFAGHGGIVTCSVTGPAVAAPQLFADRLAADFGTGANAVDVLGNEADSTILGVRASADSPQARAALAAWAIATASDTGVTWVEGNAVVVSTDGTFEWVEQVDAAQTYAGIRVAVATR